LKYAKVEGEGLGNLATGLRHGGRHRLEMQQIIDIFIRSYKEDRELKEIPETS